jgi:uncharacterized protein
MEAPMKSAAELLVEYTDLSFADPIAPIAAAAMFTEDGVFELPYLVDFGFSGRYEGRDAIAEFLEFVRGLYPGFQIQNVKILIDTPEQAFGEYEFEAVSSKTGRRVHQLFFGRLVAENGKIKLLREALNSMEVARGTFVGEFPEGLLVDSKAPSQST